ncbi:CMD-domain-containing protein [Pleurotus eryngii]|uniref:CMD-domain-containing protein n=1 Tax=Pleurotus eryngii TaxID=5323 RepID=A0A9P6A9X6_PLEER|nr:CMD-domain-containing protein [Pleurotus eryngii]
MSSSSRHNEQAHQEIYDAGMQFRRKVLGEEYVNNQLKLGVSEFTKPMQQLTTEVAWGTIWTRPGLELKQRSLICIALVASQGREAELGAHIRGAVNNGATEVEIREALLQTAVYCGIPTGMVSFRIGESALNKLKDEGKLPK